MSRTRILVVDDELGVREAIRGLLMDKYRVFTAGSGEEALEEVKKGRPDLVILDINLPGIDGLETMKNIKKFNSAIPVIMISAIDTLRTIINIMKSGADDYINKPFDIDDMKTAVRKALRKYNALQPGNSRLALVIRKLIEDTVRDMQFKGASLEEARKQFDAEFETLVLDKLSRN